MSKVKPFLGYFLAALMVPVVLATFMGMQFFSEVLVELTGVEITPWFTGGEVKTTLDHGSYQTLIHRPVFDGLFSEKAEGFVQIVWTPAGALPETIQEDIDYDGDGQMDFQVRLTPRQKTAEWTLYSTAAMQLNGPYQIGEDGIGVRVTLKNKK